MLVIEDDADDGQTGNGLEYLIWRKLFGDNTVFEIKVILIDTRVGVLCGERTTFNEVSHHSAVFLSEEQFIRLVTGVLLVVLEYKACNFIRIVILNQVITQSNHEQRKRCHTLLTVDDQAFLNTHEGTLDSDADDRANEVLLVVLLLHGYDITPQTSTLVFFAPAIFTLIDRNDILILPVEQCEYITFFYIHNSIHYHFGGE